MWIEALLRIVDRAAGNHFSKRGDVIVLRTSDEAAVVWAEMLLRGRVTQQQASDAQRVDLTYRWPWSTNELTDARYRIIEVDGGASFTQAELDTFLAPDYDGPGSNVIVRYRSYGIDFDKNGTIFPTIRDDTSRTTQVWTVSVQDLRQAVAKKL